MRVPLNEDGLNAHHTQNPDEVNLHDRLYEAYMGELGEGFQQKTKKRVDWIVSRVSGDKILDVGCSQGIIPVLLAKQKKHVTGIDIDPKVVDDAKRHVKKHKGVSKLVTFLEQDFLKFDSEGKFDAVLLTEVLEHLYEPEAFISRAYEAVKPNGQIVVTVPFGVNDHADHRQNFYMTEMYSLLSRYFEIKEVEVIEKWIGFTGRRRTGVLDKPMVPPAELLEELEKSFYSIERELTSKLDEKQRRLVELENTDSELTKLRNYTRELWRKADRLEKKYKKVSKSRSYKIGRKITYVPRKLYARPKVKKIVNGLYYFVFPNKKPVFSSSNLTYLDLFHPPKPQKKFRLNRKITDQDKLRVAAIMDDFTYTSFQYEADITQLRPDKWKEQIDNSRPEVLFVESAWRGGDNLWTNMIAGAPKELQDIVAYCRDKSIPTVFWNKEDPAHLAHFMRAASLFDYVFTTDSDSIQYYQNILGHTRVYLLPFAAQPVFNNPTEEYDRQNKFNFAGSYYKAYPDRCRDFEAVMDAALQFRGVDIYDRNFEKDVSDKFRFPEKYQQYIKGTLPYSEIGKAYKGYIYAITMNTIKYSPTMFARRAFELVASNTITVGNYSQGVRNFLGDLTIASDDREEIAKRLKTITSSELNQSKFRLLGLRRVLTQHTYKERLERILDVLFDDYARPSDDNNVLVVALVSDEKDVERALSNFDRQECETRKLVLIQATDFMEKVPDNALVLTSTNKTKVTQILRELNATHLAVMDPSLYYGRYYLTDLMLARTYSKAEIIGKSAYFAKTAKGKLSMKNPTTQYKMKEKIKISHSLLSADVMKGESVQDLVDSIHKSKTYAEPFTTLSIDGFNVSSAQELTKKEMVEVDGFLDINQGDEIGSIYEKADTITTKGALEVLKSSMRRSARSRKTYSLNNSPKES